MQCSNVTWINVVTCCSMQLVTTSWKGAKVRQVLTVSLQLALRMSGLVKPGLPARLLWQCSCRNQFSETPTNGYSMTLTSSVQKYSETLSHIYNELPASRWTPHVNSPIREESEPVLCGSPFPLTLTSLQTLNKHLNTTLSWEENPKTVNCQELFEEHLQKYHGEIHGGKSSSSVSLT